MVGNFEEYVVGFSENNAESGGSRVAPAMVVSWAGGEKEGFLGVELNIKDGVVCDMDGWTHLDGTCCWDRAFLTSSCEAYLVEFYFVMNGCVQRMTEMFKMIQDDLWRSMAKYGFLK